MSGRRVVGVRVVVAFLAVAGAATALFTLGADRHRFPASVADQSFQRPATLIEGAVDIGASDEAAAEASVAAAADEPLSESESLPAEAESSSANDETTDVAEVEAANDSSVVAADHFDGSSSASIDLPAGPVAGGFGGYASISGQGFQVALGGPSAGGAPGSPGASGGPGGVPASAPSGPIGPTASAPSSPGGGGGPSGPQGSPSEPSGPANAPPASPSGPSAPTSGPTAPSGAAEPPATTPASAGDPPPAGPPPVIAGTDPVPGDLHVLPDQLHSPGHSPGQQTIAGDYILDGLLRIEIAGTTPGLEYDQLLVGGDAILNGSIEVVLLNDFIPDPADVFDVIIADSFEIGDLFSIIFPQLPDGHYFTWSLFTLEDGQVAFRIVDPEIDAAPEPFTLALFGAGLAGLGILRRRRAI